MTVSRCIPLVMGNVVEDKKKIVEKIKIHIFLFNIFFFPKIVPFINMEKYFRAQQYTWQYNTAHAVCMLDSWGYRHALRICNTYCCATAIMVTRTHPSVTLYVHCLFFFFASEVNAFSMLGIINVSKWWQCGCLSSQYVHVKYDECPGTDSKVNDWWGGWGSHVLQNVVTIRDYIFRRN
jgi:hypothetical protein